MFAVSINIIEKQLSVYCTRSRPTESEISSSELFCLEYNRIWGNEPAWGSARKFARKNCWWIFFWKKFNFKREMKTWGHSEISRRLTEISFAAWTMAACKFDPFAADLMQFLSTIFTNHLQFAFLCLPAQKSRGKFLRNVKVNEGHSSTILFTYKSYDLSFDTSPDCFFVIRDEMFTKRIFS